MSIRKDFGKELKQRVSQKQDVEKIGSWAYSTYFKYMREIDLEFRDLLLDLNTMEEGPEFAYTYEELDRIADDLIVGKLDWAHLKELSKMRTEDDIVEFEKCLSDIALVKDLAMLGQLIDLFDDQCPYPEVMFSLVHAVESYPNEMYVKVILDKLPHGIEHFPDWFKILLYRILNEPDCSKYFQIYMNKVNREYLLYLFDVIEKESPDHREIIENMRKKLLEKHS
jgi:TusA-related sulfurtransferase